MMKHTTPFVQTRNFLLKLMDHGDRASIYQLIFVALCLRRPSPQTRSGLPQVSVLSLRSRPNNHQTWLTCSPEDQARVASSISKRGKFTSLAILEYFSIVFWHVSGLSSGVTCGLLATTMFKAHFDSLPSAVTGTCCIIP